MKLKMINKAIQFTLLGVSIYSCAPELSLVDSKKESLSTYEDGSSDTTNTASINWNGYFNDPYLTSLIDEALQNNQELNIFLQQIEMDKNEVRIRKGEYLPFVNVGGGAGFEKVGKYTRSGAVEQNLEIKEGKEFPEPLGDFGFGAKAFWEVDIWKKLRNAKKAAFLDYLATVEGRNFMITNLVSEIANSYYELLALDNQLIIVRRNIQIQSNALEVVKVQKQSAKVTELAVKRFEAQLLDTRSLLYIVQQEIVETENKLNFLLGRYPQPIARDTSEFVSLELPQINSGIPSQLLRNRPDIRQAELEMEAAKVDVKVARANFYPSLGISADLGYQAFNPKYLLNTPASLMYSFGGDLVGPVVNRNAIKAFYGNAKARQVQSVIDYEQTVLMAYIEVANQLSNMGNLQSSLELKSQ